MTQPHLQLHIGDKIQIGTPIQDGRVFWGSEQVVKRFSTDGFPIYRAKWGKVDRIATCWRIPMGEVGYEELREQQEREQR